MTIKPLEHEIGEAVRRLRGEHAVTLDALATAMRARGFEWSTGSVGNLEAGRMKVTLATVVVLADALRERCGVPITLSNLVGAAEYVELTPRIQIRTSRLLDFLAGEDVAIVSGDLAPDPQMAERASEALKRFRRYVAGDSLVEMPLAVVRAARALGISGVALQSRSLETYGRDIIEERDARAGKGASQQALGAAMRAIIKELRKAGDIGER